MGYENNDKKMESVYSVRVKAGKRRTYFFDVRETRGSDFYVTITESRKRFDTDGYERHKIFLYKEDFNKFLRGLNDTIDHVKTELMPDFDFDAFNHDTPYEGDENQGAPTNDSEVVVADADVNVDATPAADVQQEPTITPDVNMDNGRDEEVDKW